MRDEAQGQQEKLRQWAKLSESPHLLSPVCWVLHVESRENRVEPVIVATLIDFSHVHRPHLFKASLCIAPCLHAGNASIPILSS